MRLMVLMDHEIALAAETLAAGAAEDSAHFMGKLPTRAAMKSVSFMFISAPVFHRRESPTKGGVTFFITTFIRKSTLLKIVNHQLLQGS